MFEVWKFFIQGISDNGIWENALDIDVNGVLFKETSLNLDKVTLK